MVQLEILSEYVWLNKMSTWTKWDTIIYKLTKDYHGVLRGSGHGGGGPQVGYVTCGGSTHLSCKRDQTKMVPTSMYHHHKKKMTSLPVLVDADLKPFDKHKKIGNLRTTMTIGSEIPCTAQARLANFVVVVSSTTPNTVESRRPAIHKLRQV